jgi:hypothetical protein
MRSRITCDLCNFTGIAGNIGAGPVPKMAKWRQAIGHARLPGF